HAPFAVAPDAALLGRKAQALGEVGVAGKELHRCVLTKMSFLAPRFSENLTKMAITATNRANARRALSRVTGLFFNLA
ncbi:hypothetical protein ABTN76_20160, partial [Acinetobacter baumannii]